VVAQRGLPLCWHDWRQSLFVNVDHAEGCRLVGLTLVVYGEQHHLVTREAVPLLLGHLQDQRDQLLLVLLCIDTRQVKFARERKKYLRR